MESRKRPLPDDDGTSTSKKRILTGANGSPRANGAADDEEENFANKLELFRKEAIFRRMKHYSRENERSLARIQELEQRKTTCEAGLAAMSACWSQLVETIRLLVQPEDIPDVGVHAQDIFDLTCHIQDETSPEFAAALSETVNATQALVTKFVQLGPHNGPRVVASDAFPQCQKAQNECHVLRSELSVLRAKLEDCENQKHQYHTALMSAQNQLERSKSQTVRMVETRSNLERDGESGQEGKEEVQRTPSSPAVSSTPNHVNGSHDSAEIDSLVEKVQRRDAKIAELENEAALLRDQKTMLELDVKAPPTEQITEHPLYKALYNHAVLTEQIVAERDAQIAKLSEDILVYQTQSADWEEHSTNASNQIMQDLRNNLLKRDQENARLREQREQQASELVERKQKDAVKCASLQEYKFLAENNSERVGVLQSELSRCKAQLAANANAKDIMLFFLGGDHDQFKYWESLKAQKQQYENRIVALEQTLSNQQDQATQLRGEAHALEQLAEARTQLAFYERTFGNYSSLPPDANKLAQQLRVKEEELERLRLSEMQSRESEAAVYSELEKLTSLWESLNQELKSKVFDLAAMEERLTKSGLDKAKSDNKYFAAMRDKEAVDNERKNLVRTLEKQSKVVDRLTEVEKQLRHQLLTCQNELSQHKKLVNESRNRIAVLEKENPELHTCLETEQKRVKELSTLNAEREQSMKRKYEDYLRQVDDLSRSCTQYERQITLLRSERSTEVKKSTSTMEDEVVTNLKKILICSTCKGPFRNTVITKCMHTFCKGCVDSRLQTRQRKCPACNLPFGTSDVQTIYFQ
ncbi:BRE1 E3 ubiquitin ligase-domain-containing protein [Panaeolus papilionaceus]|nr:BRE1 E3 ubiquitin ligase-domain-containing protein [Panaeolus papilionaceus]